MDNDQIENEAQAGGAPSFQGKLQLQDFMHTPPSSSPRRSTRLQPLTRSPSSTPSREPSRTPIKKDKRRKRPPTGYAPPSTYAHLPPLPDAILPNLIILFIGLVVVVLFLRGFAIVIIPVTESRTKEVGQKTALKAPFSRERLAQE